MTFSGHPCLKKISNIDIQKFDIFCKSSEVRNNGLTDSKPSIIIPWFFQKNVLNCPVAINLLKVNNRNTRTRCKICSKFNYKDTRWRSGVFIVNFEHVIAGCVVLNQTVTASTLYHICKKQYLRPWWIQTAPAVPCMN